MAIAVPMALANEVIELQLALLGEQPLPLPQLEPWLPPFGRVAVRVRKAQLLPVDTDGAALQVTLEVKHRDELLVTMTCQAHLRPVIEGWKVVLGLRPSDIEAIKPTLGPKSQERIQGALLQLMPKAVRRFIPKSEMRSLASSLVTYLASEGFHLVRKSLLVRFGEVTKLSFDLPKIPIKSALLRSLTLPRPNLRIEVQTPLPVRDGLPERRQAYQQGLVEISLAGSTVAELGNCAMVGGLIPHRYNSKFKPAPNGPYWPQFDWIATDNRPLKIDVTKTSRPCLKARVGARPIVSVAKQRLQVGITDGKIEEVDGPLLFTIGAWVWQLWARPIQVARKLVAQFNFRAGGRRLSVQIRTLTADTASVTGGLHVVLGPGSQTSRDETEGQTQGGDHDDFRMVCWQKRPTETKNRSQNLSRRHAHPRHALAALLGLEILPVFLHPRALPEPASRAPGSVRRFGIGSKRTPVGGCRK